MKSYLTPTLAVVSVLLAVVLFITKRSDNAQMEADAGAFADCSNRLETAQSQLTARGEQMVLLSNRLDECQSASATLSNRLTEAQSTLALQTEQITGLNRQVVETAAENRDLSRRVTDLTNQVAALTGRIADTEASLSRTNADLVQLHKDYALLENRFRCDVAERVVAERKFNNLAEVRAQLKKLMKYPTPWVTPQSVYAGLDVEVKSNGTVHVISPE